MSHAQGDDDIEGPPGVGRVEAYSDGVIAIIVTIMVLELHAPLTEGIDRLWTLWPVFLAYILSYAYVSIYWVNHHRLFSHARVVTNSLVWSNILLLFALSLIPFTTSYLGAHHFNRDATLLYLASALLPAFSYSWLQATIRKTGKRGPNADAYHRRSTRKGILATVLYAAGMPLTLISPWLGIGCAVIVAVLWFLPVGPLDLIFDDR
ncbi:MAG: TMEM175 family protein [Sphingomonas sp.]